MGDGSAVSEGSESDASSESVDSDFLSSGRINRSSPVRSAPSVASVALASSDGSASVESVASAASLALSPSSPSDASATSVAPTASAESAATADLPLPSNASIASDAAEEDDEEDCDEDNIPVHNVETPELEQTVFPTWDAFHAYVNKFSRDTNQVRILV
jgi:hypothetical protein